MIPQPPIPSRVLQLINAVCDEVATEQEIDELDRLLRADKRSLQAYKRYCQLHFEMNFVGSIQQMANRAAATIARTGEPKPDRIASPVLPPVAPAKTHPAKSPVLGFLGGAIDYVNQSRMLMFWIVAAAVGGWFVFQIGSLVVDRAGPRCAKNCRRVGQAGCSRQHRADRARSKHVSSAGRLVGPHGDAPRKRSRGVDHRDCRLPLAGRCLT